MKHAIKGLLAVAILGVVLWAGWARYRNFLYQGSLPSEGTLRLNEMEKSGVPQFSILDIHGKEISLKDFKDQIVIINFWASWCDPCVQEFPSLLRLIEHFKGKVVLLAISADHTESDLRTFLKAFKAEADHVYVMWDKDQSIAKKYGTQVLPESYILGYNNKLIRKIAGVDTWDSPDAITFFSSLVEMK